MGFGNVSKNYPDTSTTLQHYSTTSTVNRLMSMRLYSYYFSLTRHKPERLVEYMYAAVQRFTDNNCRVIYDCEWRLNGAVMLWQPYCYDKINE